MAPKIDSEILKALSLDTENSTRANHGGSGFASTYKIASIVNGKEMSYFIKQGKGKESEIMFAGEHMSLNAIHTAVPNFCPKSYANGKLSDGSGSFLATDFLNLSRSSGTKGSRLSLAQKLAELHSIPAPIPEAYEQPQFGFPVPTCCGNTEQDNSFKRSWADFYADNRLRHILSCAEKNNGKDAELRTLVETTASIVVPRLLGDGHLKSPDGENITPVVVHGDLWSGNHGTGSIGSDPAEEVVFDPSCAWAHAEFEFGIMHMFGGFGSSFEQEYHIYKPVDEPANEFDDRIQLYELYHHLNHFAMFGGSYKGGAVRIMDKLIKKYGSDD